MMNRLLQWLFRRSKPQMTDRAALCRSWQLYRQFDDDMAEHPEMCLPTPPSRPTQRLTRIIAHPTRPMPMFDAQFYGDETIRVERGADPNATELVEVR